MKQREIQTESKIEREIKNERERDRVRAQEYEIW